MDDYDPEESFSPALFIDKSYIKKSFCFGEHTIEAMLLESAATDYDLTGQVIWPAARVLSNYMIKNENLFHNKCVLEVGSGIGLCGLLASRFASETFLTDYEDVVLEVLQKNVNLNQVSSCHCKKLDWGNETNIGELLKLKPNGFDIIIGSDVVYWKTSIPPLLTTISALLSHNEGSMFILCYQSRATITDEYLLQQSGEFGFHHQFFVLEPQEQSESGKSVYLFIFKRSKSL